MGKPSLNPTLLRRLSAALRPDPEGDRADAVVATHDPPPERR